MLHCFSTRKREDQLTETCSRVGGWVKQLKRSSKQITLLSQSWSRTAGCWLCPWRPATCTPCCLMKTGGTCTWPWRTTCCRPVWMTSRRTTARSARESTDRFRSDDQCRSVSGSEMAAAYLTKDEARAVSSHCCLLVFIRTWVHPPKIVAHQE